MTNATVSRELSRVLKLAVEKKFSERQFYRDEVILELVTSLVIAFPEILGGDVDLSWERSEEQAEKLASQDTLWDSVKAVLAHADFSVTRNTDDNLKIKRWSHQPPQSLGGKKDVDPSATMDELAQCTTTYINAEWAKSPTLELWLVRQMIFAETYAFSRETDTPLQHKSFKFLWILTISLVKWFVGLGVAFSVGESYGLAVGVLTYVVWLSVTRYLAQDQLDRQTRLEKTFDHMKTTYVLSLRSPACPVEIEKSMSLAENHHVLWPAGLRRLVEIGLARNRSVWA